MGVLQGKGNMSCALRVIQGTYFSDNYCVSLSGVSAPYVWEVGWVVYINTVNHQTGSGNRWLSELRAYIVMNVCRNYVLLKVGKYRNCRIVCFGLLLFDSSCCTSFDVALRPRNQRQ